MLISLFGALIKPFEESFRMASSVLREPPMSFEMLGEYIISGP